MTDRAYVRISLDSLTSGSIDKQRATLGRKASAGVVFYEDRSTSGSIPFGEREGGRRLLADLQLGDRVLVTKIDRAARSMHDLLGLVQRIGDAGATITFTEQEGIDDTPVGGLMLKILGAVAEFERDLIAERRRESLAAFKEEGRHAVGRAPFGLRSVPNPNGRGLVLRPDPETALVLRDVVERLLAGTAQRQLSAEVGMQHPAFGRLLRNERLAGVLGVGPEGVRMDPEQAVFTPAEWRVLQEYLGATGHRTWSRAQGIGGALACGVCGDRLYLNVSKRNPDYSTYRCRKVRGHGPNDPAASVIARNADAQVEADYLGRFGRFPVLDVVQVGSSAARDNAVALAKMNLNAIRRAQDEAATEAEEESLFSAYLKAKRDLREAEAISSEVVFDEVPTGETFAQAWGRADDQTRTAFLLKVGPWVVEPGRLPIEAKVHLPADAEHDYLAGQNYPGDGQSPGPRAAAHAR